MWRLYDAGAQDAATAIGRMPVLAAAVASGRWDGILLTGYWGRAHFNVGWFEDVDAVVDLEAARREGVEVVRRPMIGGGTAFYDAGCAAMAAFFVPPRDHESLDDVFARHEPVLRKALDALGLGEAVLQSGDIRFRGRKLGALISQAVAGVRVAGCFLNLRRPDLELYRRVAHVPPEKLADKEVRDMVAYVATPEDVRGSPLSYPELRDAIVAASGLRLEPVGPTPEEDAGIQSLASLVSSDDWVRRVSSTRFAAQAPAGTRVGFANHKGRKLVRAGVAVDGQGIIRAAMLAGDMHLSPPNVLDDLSGDLTGVRELAEIRARVERALRAPGVEQADAHLGVTPDDFLAAISAALKQAAGR